MIEDIPETYGMWLSRDWSELKGYFATDWSHLWLPLNGNPNKLKVDRDPFMKQTIIDLDGSNESVSFLIIKLNISHLTPSLETYLLMFCQQRMYRSSIR